MLIGIPKESKSGETRVSITPDAVKKLIKKDFQIVVETGAGVKAGFPDSDYLAAGATVGDRAKAWSAKIVAKVQRPTADEISLLSSGSILIGMLEPFSADQLFQTFAEKKVSAVSMELIPRTSRAQSMDVLSSQANIAGFRAVLEAASRYGRFFSMMMTSAGMSKPARVLVLGAGVAGLQAIATARRLGAQVEAFDVRAEVKEQIQSLGAKFFEIDLGEEGSGQGGYAKELSEAAKQKQIQALTDKIQKVDIVISTANIPGRKAPTLITEAAVKGMRAGSVIVDMAAASGGNCPLSVADEVVVKEGVVLVGTTNFPALLPTDSSNYYANNIVNFLALMPIENGELKVDFNDDILLASFAVWNGEVKWKRK